MNSARNINARMLRQFAVKTIKEHYQIEESIKQFDLIREIVMTKNDVSISKFVTSNFNNTKQHIYIFELQPGFNSRNFNTSSNPFFTEILQETHQNGEHTYFISPIVVFEATVKNLEDGSYTPVSMQFKQPICISVIGNHLIIRATILEKNITAYLSDLNNKAIDVNKDVDDDFVSTIIEYFTSIGITVIDCDINRGVKHLCNNNIIDFKYVKFRKSRSTATESMDENYTFKQAYPTQYTELMRSPLDKCFFKYLRDDDTLCKHFSADPSAGTISISIYPETPNQITNVITQILRNN